MIEQIQSLSEFYQPIRNIEYDFLVWLANFRTPFLNTIFFLATLMGGEYFYMCLIPVFFIFFDRKKACSFSILILVSLLINAIIKHIVSIPRPMDDIVTPLYVSFAKGYSFPSGHAQGSITLWGLIIISNKKSIKLLVTSILMILLISFSRLYLGVHFPLDIVSGWIIGITVLLCYILLLKTKCSFSKWIPIAVFIIISILIPETRIQKIGLTLAGIYLGKPEEKNNLFDRKNTFYVLIPIISALVLLKIVPPYAVYLLLGISLHLVSLFLIKKS